MAPGEASIELTALEASHPAAFLASLGMLDLLASGGRGARLSWRQSGAGWRPWLNAPGVKSQEELVQALALVHSERDIEKELGPDKLHNLDRGEVQAALLAAKGVACEMRAALVAELPLSRSGKPPLSPFVIFQPGQGRNFTRLARENSSLDPKRLCQQLHEALFGPWRYKASKVNPMRWDPVTSLQERAYERDASTHMGTRAVPGVMLLAIRGLRFYPTITTRHRAVPRGWVATNEVRGNGARRWARSFVWPVWSGGLGRDELRLLLSHPELVVHRPNWEALRAHGVERRYVADLSGPSDGAQALSWGDPV